MGPPSVVEGQREATETGRKEQEARPQSLAGPDGAEGAG